MNVVDASVLVILGMALVAGAPAVVYFLLPPKALEAAGQHGRYAGLGSPLAR